MAAVRNLRIPVPVLVVVMAVGSLAMWTLVPVAWLWVASNIMRSNLFSYLFALVACPASMVLFAGQLGRVQDAYSRRSGLGGRSRRASGWLRSASDERRSLRGLTLLDALLIASAMVALATLLAYIFFVSHPTVVTGPTAPGNEHGM
jgi:hypothetical protein